MARKAIFTLLLSVLSLLISCGQHTAPPQTPRPVRIARCGRPATTAHRRICRHGGCAGGIHAGLSGGRKIQTRQIDVGSQVKKARCSSLIAKMYNWALPKPKANARTAQTQFELASLEFKRFSDLLKTGAISQSAVDAKNAALAAAKPI